MCRSQDLFSDVYRSDIKNPYRFSSQIDTLMRRNPDNLNFELASTLYSLNSNFKKALAFTDSIPPNSYTPITTIDTNFVKEGYNIFSAKEYIINQSRNSEIVILNEAHHNNSHKVFAESLLAGLYKNGYRLLFLETLSNGKLADTSLNKRKYPVVSSGFYSRNPQFGNFIRKALDIGFEIYPYETTAVPGSIDEDQRERDQANNIVKILENFPDYKALIYVGYGHNIEGQMIGWGKTMAQLVKELTDNDPLTISQDRFTEKSSKILSPPILAELDLIEPSILLDKNKLPYKTSNDNSWTDITVFHPLTKYKYEKPNWLFYDEKKVVPIDLEKIEIDFPIMLMAYNNNDEINNEAVPLDIVEIQNKDEKAKLVLNKGKYVVRAINQKSMYQLLYKTVH